MLTYSFENIGNKSLYEHLYNCIKEDILSGKLLPDYKLPSKRNFAKNLGVSTITIENSYAQLMAEGYIYSLPKKGYYVTDIALLQPVVSTAASASATVNSHHAVSIKNDIVNKPVSTNRFDLTTNYTNKANFPFYTWAKLMKDVMADNSDHLLTPSPSGGTYALRDAICSHLRAFRGMEVSPAQIIVGAGTEYLYSLLIQLLRRDKTFAVEDPGYHKIRLIYENNNVKCVALPMSADGIDTAALDASDADILHISPSHHYPTGIVTSISKRYELLRWASQSDNRYIIEDDYDCEFRLLGKPIPSLQSIDMSDKVIYMNTFTKTLTPTIRISYMVLPLPLLERFNAELNFYSCTVSNFEQYTLARFISEGHFEKHINRMRIFYRKQRDMFINAINQSPVKNLVSIQEEDAGLHFLLKVKTKLSDEELTQKALDNGLKIACMSQYYYNMNNALPHTIIINYSGIESEKIEHIVECLYNCIK